MVVRVDTKKDCKETGIRQWSGTKSKEYKEEDVTENMLGSKLGNTPEGELASCLKDEVSELD